MREATRVVNDYSSIFRLYLGSFFLQHLLEFRLIPESPNQILISYLIHFFKADLTLSKGSVLKYLLPSHEAYRWHFDSRWEFFSGLSTFSEAVPAILQNQQIEFFGWNLSFVLMAD